MSKKIPRYIILEKPVGATPLEVAENWRTTQDETYQNLPLAYAGRLDPMASGKLLILIGEECKRQQEYHHLDKAYEFSVLFGVSSDTQDVLGRLNFSPQSPLIDRKELKKVATSLVKEVSLPYPHFSAKTVHGKPLHMWTLEKRLDEIEIPVQTSTVYRLKLVSMLTKSRQQIYEEALTKVNSIPEVTDPRKRLGNDFRRQDVRSDWQKFSVYGQPTDIFTIAHFYCLASSGTYMRSLAQEIGKLIGTKSLAYHIHRTNIGKYQSLTKNLGFWWKRY